MFLALKQDILLNTIVPLPQFNDNLSLVNHNELYLMGNVCPHQRARLTKCAIKELQCPYHGLKFNIQGQGIENGFLLQRTKCYENQTMVFDRPVKHLFPVDTSFMVLKERRIDKVLASVDIITDVFLDITHIPVAHPGVYDQISISDIDAISWETFDNGSIQYVPAQDNTHMIDSDKSYNIGACWLAVYPGTMIEWQPGAMFVTVALDNTTGSDVHIFKYKDSRYSNDSYIFNEQIWETAWAQDKDLAENIVELPMQNLDPLKEHHRTWSKNVL